MSELVHLEVTDAVATVTLDSPPNRNALSHRLLTELDAHLRTAEQDDAVRAVVIAATGPVFCSGADLSEAAAGGMEQGARALVALQRRIVALPKPVVTRVQGAVRAGGLGIVGASDIVVAAEEVSFALTEVRLALAPAAISLTLLPRLSSRAAAYAFLTGARFTAAEAVGMGLVTTAVPADRLDAEVGRITAELAAGAAQGLRETKALLARDLLEHIDARGEEVAALSARLFGSDAAREAMQAFLSRKK